MTLAVRARDVMPNGGTVDVETANATLVEGASRTHPTAKPGNYVRISVSDTGRSIDAEEQKQLFEPFAADEDQGAGLALGTLYRNVVSAGGFVDVDSIVGEGTTFRIYWPETSERPVARPILSETPKLPGGTETILLVEHEALTNDALGKLLKALGYRVLSANDGIEALRLAARRYLDIDMVISDLVLPGMNGLELGRELLKMRKTLRMLYLSDAAEGAGRIGIGPDKLEFLQKPVHQDVLAKRVREVLDRRANS